jgi:hypothetical protein
MPLSADDLQTAMWALAVDRVAIEAVQALESAGVDVLLVKGPVIAAWLYAGEVRGYGDGDLVVAAPSWDRAVAVLEGLGFVNYLEPLAHPRMESQAGTGFVRGMYSVDLHTTLAGLCAHPALVWELLWSASGSLMVSGRSVRVPDRPAVLMHVALHAAHHVDGKPLSDLARAVQIASDREWLAAAALARRLDGLEAFANGLRLLPETQRITELLELENVRSLRHDLREARVPMAEGLNEFLIAPVRSRPRMLLQELFPNSTFMRWAMPLARRGPVGLAASYPCRWMAMVGRLPAAALAVCRARRRGS